MVAVEAKMIWSYPWRFNRLAREQRELAGPVRSTGRLHLLPQNASMAVPFRYHPASPAGRKIAVFVHAFWVPEMLDDIERALGNIPFPFDLYFTTDTPSKLDHISARFGGAMAIIAKNIGRDIYPKLYAMGHLHGGYDYVLHIHTKKSEHRHQLKDWRQFLWDHLLGSPEIVRSIIDIFEQCPDVGMVAPQHLGFIRAFVRWEEESKEIAAPLARKFGVDVEKMTDIDFPSGSMFWARPKALEPLLRLHLNPSDFPEERGQVAGTTAHAIERLFFVSCEAAGFKWVKIAVPKWHSVKVQIQSVSDPAIVKSFVSRRNVSLLTRDSLSPKAQAGAGSQTATHLDGLYDDGS